MPGRRRSSDRDEPDLAWSAGPQHEQARHELARHDQVRHDQVRHAQAQPERQIEWAGVVVAAMVAVWAAVLVFSFSSALAEVNWWLAPALNLGAVAGFGPLVWGWRGRPVLRFLAVGLGAGVALGWLALILRWR